MQFKVLQYTWDGRLESPILTPAEGFDIAHWSGMVDLGTINVAVEELQLNEEDWETACHNARIRDTKLKVAKAQVELDKQKDELQKLMALPATKPHAFDD